MVVAFRNGLATAVVLLGLIGAVATWAKQGVDHEQGESAMPARTIEAVLSQYTDSLMSVSGVVGTAIGESAGKPCITVFVVRKAPEPRHKIPSTLEGFPVVVEETGEIRALDST